MRCTRLWVEALGFKLQLRIKSFIPADYISDYYLGEFSSNVHGSDSPLNNKDSSSIPLRSITAEMLLIVSPLRDDCATRARPHNDA